MGRPTAKCFHGLVLINLVEKFSLPQVVDCRDPSILLNRPNCSKIPHDEAVHVEILVPEDPIH